MRMMKRKFLAPGDSGLSCAPKGCARVILFANWIIVRIPGFIDKPGLPPSPEAKGGSLAN